MFFSFFFPFLSPLFSVSFFLLLSSYFPFFFFFFIPFYPAFHPSFFLSPIFSHFMSSPTFPFPSFFPLSPSLFPLPFHSSLSFIHLVSTFFTSSHCPSIIFPFPLLWFCFFLASLNLNDSANFPCSKVST